LWIQVRFLRIEGMSQSTVNKFLIYTALLFLLNGCGGGGGGSGEGGGGSGEGGGGSGEGGGGSGEGDGTALISWKSPTRNIDDTVLTDLAGFKIYYGMFPGDYDKSLTLNNEGLSSYLMENLAAADWCFVITAFNSAGIESDYSIEVCKTID
jgi:hypothetical protein